MDQGTHDPLAMHRQLASFFEQHRKEWSQIPNLKKRVEEYMRRQALLPETLPGGAAGAGERQGTAVDDRSATERLVDLLPPMAAALHLWLLDPENPKRNAILATKLDIRRPSKLRTLDTKELLKLAQLALDQLSGLPDGALTEYGMNADDVALFEQATTPFGLKRNQPRPGRDNALARVEDELDELHAYVTGELRKSVEVLRTKNQPFVRGFKGAYQLIKRRGAHRGAERKAPPAPRNMDRV